VSSNISTFRWRAICGHEEAADMSSRPPQYDPSQYPPYVPPEASQASAPLPDAPPFAPLSPEQAIFSVIFAVIGATLLPIFAQIVSITLGARALRRIKASDGSIIGRRLAWFGIIFSALCLFGYLALIALIIYGVLSLGTLGAS
jgi:hypothetical protein